MLFGSAAEMLDELDDEAIEVNDDDDILLLDLV